MGYFANGCEGADYQERYCFRCAHDVDQDCPIWLAHLLHNGDEGPAGEILDLLIPRAADGLGNRACVMFVPRSG